MRDYSVFEDLDELILPSIIVISCTIEGEQVEVIEEIVLWEDVASLDYSDGFVLVDHQASKLVYGSTERWRHQEDPVDFCLGWTGEGNERI